jgi:hypothetical protein
MNIVPMTDQLAHARIRVVEIAQSILDGKVRPLIGARMLAGYVNPLKAEISFEAWSTVVAIASETDGMPIGAERQYWAPEPLRERTRELMTMSEELPLIFFEPRKNF